MSDSKKPHSAKSPSSSGSPKRINTQIHRRSKAKAVYPLSDEWEDTAPTAPKQLRMPSTNMKKTASDHQTQSDQNK